MRCSLLAAAGLAALLSTCAWADDLVAIKPGVMCAAPAALARLTRPNGDSRTHLPSATPQDFAIAQAGGCIDISPGLRVTVQKAFHNTSIVTYGDATMIVPNIDFRAADSGAADSGQAAPSADQGFVPPVAGNGYSVAQRVPTGDLVLEVLEDQRITPSIHKAMWKVSDDPSFVFSGNDRLVNALQHPPLRNARVRLLSASGETVAERTLERPLAEVAPAPLHFMPSSTFLLTVDYSTGMGSYAGPLTELLEPAVLKLQPMPSVTSDGGSGALVLAESLKRGWRVVPWRADRPEEIQSVASVMGDGEQFYTTCETYRLSGGLWRSADRREPGMWESDEPFPDRLCP